MSLRTAGRWPFRLAAILGGVALVGSVSGSQTRADRREQTAPAAAPQKPAQSAPPKPQAVAVATALPAGATVAYVRLQGVFADSKFGRCSNALLDAMRAKDQAAIAPKQKELQDLQARMNAQQGAASAETLTLLKRDADRSQLDLQSLTQQLQADLANKEQDVLDDFRRKAAPLLEAVRKDKGLTFILSPDQPGEILAADPALDVTAEVVRRLDAAYPSCTPKGGD